MVYIWPDSGGNGQVMNGMVMDVAVDEDRLERCKVESKKRKKVQVRRRSQSARDQ